MSPRASLPGADELFRATTPYRTDSLADASESRPAVSVEPDPTREAAQPAGAQLRAVAPERPSNRRRGGAQQVSTGREKHDEKITVYVSAGELVDLERARLALRAEHGIAVDRGRIVREALSVVLADLEAKQGESILVRRLSRDEV